MRTLLGVKDNESSATARWGNDRGTIKQRTDLIFATSRMAGGEVRPQTALMSVKDNSFEISLSRWRRENRARQQTAGG